jgi:toxin ParE1/3/4
MKKYEVRISNFAESDINEIMGYLIIKNREFCLSLYAKLKSKISQLEYFPEKGRIVPELEKNGINNYKELIEGNYRIIYSINNEHVNVLSIIDSRRNLEEILIKKVIDYFE